MECKRQLRIGDQGITRRTAQKHNINLNDYVGHLGINAVALHQEDHNNPIEVISYKLLNKIYLIFTKFIIYHQDFQLN